MPAQRPRVVLGELLIFFVLISRPWGEMSGVEGGGRGEGEGAREAEKARALGPSPL